MKGPNHEAMENLVDIMSASFGRLLDSSPAFMVAENLKATAVSYIPRALGLVAIGLAMVADAINHNEFADHVEWLSRMCWEVYHRGVKVNVQIELP